MVWKIFAPRFMAAAAGVVAVDLTILLSIALGLERVQHSVGRIFKSMRDGAGDGSGKQQ